MENTIANHEDLCRCQDCLEAIGIEKEKWDNYYAEIRSGMDQESFQHYGTKR